MKAAPAIVGFVALVLVNAGITLVINQQLQKNKQDSAPMEAKQLANTARHNDITAATTVVEPSVVSVNVIKMEIVRGYRGFGLFDFFGGMPMQRQVQGFGSGVIYDPSGLVVTNAHVVDGASQITVVLPDKREFDAQLVGIDEEHDIAKLKINGSNLPHSSFGASSDLIIGEWAIALGNPFAYIINDSKPSVSVGVISALNRSFAPQQGRSYRGMIQTDAAINQGNSGGPLVNIRGEIIGINTFIVSGSGGNIGLGFAIPSDQVKQVLQTL